MSKGSKRRPTKQTVYNREWERIFKKKDKYAKTKKEDQ